MLRIFLIAGHGDGDGGAVGNGYQEADLTREIVVRLPRYLENYAQVVIGDLNRNWFTWLRSNSFNFTPYDYVLEIHFNAGAEDEAGDGFVTGSEIYVTTSESSVIVEENILDNLEQLGLTNRGVKRKNFSVIAKAKAQGVSSALLEVAFIDDRDDMDLYQAQKDVIAESIAHGILEGFGIVEKGEILTMTQYEELSERISAIEDLLEETEIIYNYIDDNMPVWARPTIEKLVNAGWLRGNEAGELELTEDMLRGFVVNDRAGVYDRI